jgi:hypothetical protein
MDIKKLKEELAKMPSQGYKNNMFVGKSLPLKFGKPITPKIKQLAKKLGITVKECGIPDISDFGEVDGIPEFDEKTKKVEFDATAFFANKNLVEFWDEMNINGITGETFTNGENN